MGVSGIESSVMENRNAPDWSKLIPEFESSGLPAAKFAKSRSLALSTLRYHIRRSRISSRVGRQKPSGFVELPVVLSGTQTAGKEKRTSISITIADVNIRIEVGA